MKPSRHKNYHKLKKATNGKFRLDLAEIEEFLYKLQEAPDKVRSSIEKVAHTWGDTTKKSYISMITYAMGFPTKPQHRNKTAFFEVEYKDEDNLRISVGHLSFIARFLECGTVAHDIPHRAGTDHHWVIAHVSGITGSKALANAYKQHYDSIGKQIADEINKILTD